MSYIYRERTVTLTSNAGTILLGVEILLGRLRLWWIQLGTLWRRRTGTCGTWWHRQHRSGANQTHGRAGAWSHHKWTALIEEGRYDLEMISVFFCFSFYTKLLFMFCCCCCCFFTGLDVDFVVSFFVVIKQFCFLFYVEKEKRKNTTC